MFGKKNTNQDDNFARRSSGKWMIQDIVPANSDGVKPVSLHTSSKKEDVEETHQDKKIKSTLAHKLPPRRRAFDFSRLSKIFQFIAWIFDLIIRGIKYPTALFTGRSHKVHAYSEPKTFHTAGRKKIMAVAGAVIIIILALLAVDFLSYVTLKITPRQEMVDISTSLRGVKSGGGDMPIEVMSFQKITEVKGPATGMQEVSKSASGRIVIYNAYSSDSQILIRRTRFETPDGKIYRIPETITVPGAEIKDGKIVPSSIEVEVVADKAGEDYNISLTDFTIPGFKGTARYSKFYARSKTDMTGGFVGVRQVATQEDIDKLKSQAKKQLHDEIFAEYEKQVPEDFILLDNAYRIAYKDELISPPADEEGSEVVVRMSGTFQGLMLSKQSVSQALAKAYLGKDASDNIFIQNIGQLNKKVKDINFDKNEILVDVSGRAHMVWTLDEENLKREFIAKEKTISELFNSYKIIERAEVLFWPSWWHIIPRNIDRVRVDMVLLPF